MNIFSKYLPIFFNGKRLLNGSFSKTRTLSPFFPPRDPQSIPKDLAGSAKSFFSVVDGEHERGPGKRRREKWYPEAAGEFQEG